MSSQVAEKPDGNNFIQHIALITGVILLPGLQWSVLGWLHGLIPLVSFYYLYRFGRNIGKKYLVSAIIISIFVSFFTGTLPEVLFAVSLMPGGFIVSYCASRNDTIISGGLKATLVVLLSWTTCYFLFSAVNETSGYSLFLQTLDKTVTETIAYYKNTESLPPDAQVAFEQALRNAQVLLPKILPALLTSTALLMVLLAMATGNYIIFEKTGHSPWPKFQLWQLPEQLIWFFIGALFFFIIGQDTLSIIGVNILIVLGLLYCIQGFSIVLYFFSKWNLPRFMRVVLIIMILFQTIGTVILLGLGLWNTWVDFRKMKLLDQNEGINNNNK